MPDTESNTHGGKRENSGRKKIARKKVTIELRQTVLDKWDAWLTKAGMSRAQGIEHQTRTKTPKKP